MRRALSVILFVFGGWMLLSEFMVAFVDAEPGVGDNLAMLGMFALTAGVPLLLGAWSSPGDRWRELGLTILIAAGIAVFCGISVVAVFSDPGFKPFIPPMPKIALAPIAGTANLLLITALGWLLYRQPARGEPDLEQVFGDG